EVPPAFQIKIKTAPIKAFYRSHKFKNLLVIDKENGGKADSLNAGINASKFAYFLALDADTLIAEDAIFRAISPMITQKNVIATGGTVGVINDCLFKDGKVLRVRFPRNFFAGIQVIEYIRAYLFGRVGWNWLGGNLVISGAFGLFNKQLVLDNGGYLIDTVGEDLELTLKLHHSHLSKGTRYKIVSIPDTVCWTEVPEDHKTLARQRERWHRGLIDSMVRHKGLFLNPKYGVTGMFTFPFFVIGEMISPIVELLGWISFPIGLYLGIINLEFFLLFILASVGLSLILTFSSIILAQISLGKYHSEKDFIKMFFYTLIENLGYRQMTVVWRLKGFIMYFQGNKTWGEMKRIGIKKEDTN
ncbi:MAG: glycosyltransferase, partial [Halobacteriovoraceae bacterium]|nr:glycosyltransferase [Halobacteriovoraceae bacterium]